MHSILSHVIIKIISGIDNGCIVNVNDVCGFKPVLACNQPISPAYSCSKSALTAWTECLRLELAQNESNIKIIVNTYKHIMIYLYFLTVF